MRQVSQGGTGTAGFTITQLTRIEPPRRYEKQATTRAQNRAFDARGDATTAIPFATYVINQSLVASDEPGTWALVSVECDGRLVPFAQGRAIVRVTRENPQVTCTFTNRLVSDSTPVPPPVPVVPVVPGTVPNNLVVIKTADRARAQVGDVVGYDLTARNDGEALVEQVFLADQPAAGGEVLSASPSQGTCSVRNGLVICRLGALAPGEEATVRVRLRMTAPGRVRNFAVVGSGASEVRLGDNIAVAAAQVSQAGPSACPAAIPPTARAAC